MFLLICISRFDSFVLYYLSTRINHEKGYNLRLIVLGYKIWKGSQHYFQDAKVPEAVKQFESLVSDGAGDGGTAVHLSAQEQEGVAAMEKVYAFNKIAGDKVIWPNSH